ncbi:MAG: bifunctional adenosylcobinamide kinase/adenosylcobinamide-phosphate guanylyltransferase [Anaerovoracaceae bacterium]
MVLVTGGAYQGKTDYVKKEYGVSDSDIFVCSPDSAEIDTDKKVIAELDKYVLALVKAGKDPEEEAPRVAEMLKDKIVTVTDISQGVVPVDTVERAWREGNGRFTVYLAKQADTVVRVFCGIPEKLK